MEVEVVFPQICGAFYKVSAGGSQSSFARVVFSLSDRGLSVHVGTSPIQSFRRLPLWICRWKNRRPSSPSKTSKTRFPPLFAFPFMPQESAVEYGVVCVPVPLTALTSLYTCIIACTAILCYCVGIRSVQHWCLSICVSL